jgi:formate dehydrogenase subunit gamma
VSGRLAFDLDLARTLIDRKRDTPGATLAESCQSMGCEDLVSHFELRHGIKVGDGDDRSELHVETVYCLGNCALSPAALLDGAPIGRLDRDRIDAIVAAAQGKTQ